MEPAHLFYCKNKDTYPPFKNGLYMEEYFIDRFFRETPTTKRKYIPLPWTNFQIESWFEEKKSILQKHLDEWIQDNPSSNGYFTIVQYDDGPLLKLPENTLVFGACSGHIPLPLIYQDNQENLSKQSLNLEFKKRKFKFSFVGSCTHSVRSKMIESIKNIKDCNLVVNNYWKPSVSKNSQITFVDISNQSKFGLAPRGYGRSSFRFFELLKINVIPIYIWDDIEWLPYKEIIDYNKFCISINIADICNLEEIINSIDESKYNQMWIEYEKIKHMFTLDGMYEYIINYDV